MGISHLEVLVEEPSMEVALRRLLPKMLGETTFEVYPTKARTNCWPSCRAGLELFAFHTR